MNKKLKDMALDKLLKKENEYQEERKRLQLETQKENALKDEHFLYCSKLHFETVIIPELKNIVLIFRENGFAINFGNQDVHPKIYRDSLGVASVSLKFRNCIMQVDIVANRAERNFSFNAYFASNFKPDNRSVFYSISETTKEKIEEFIKENIEILRNYCP
jgi:hypothetical protein